MKKILILAANPTDTSQLRLDEEVREIQAVHRKARNREDIEVTSEWAVRVDSLRSTLLYEKPNIVHFCGHGERGYGLLLENQYGKKQLVSNESLGGLFELFKNDIECVVLNACYGEVQAEAIHEHINCVIGMNYKVGDKAAIEFATGFYDALFNGRSYLDSFEFGKNALDLENIPESQTPQIKIRDISQSLIDSNSIDSKYIYPTPEKLVQPIKYIPKQGTPNFVGREKELATIHESLKLNSCVSISAISGMSGMGKTELAIHYANENKYNKSYPGGICWINAKETNPAAEIIQRFQRHYTNLKIPQKINGKSLNQQQQLEWCWQSWQPSSGAVLLIYDDITDLNHLRLALPTDNRFRVLLTTRIRHLDANIKEIPLDVLPADKALELLTKLLGRNRVQQEGEAALQLCEWFGYLPLGVELVGRYLLQQPDLSLAEMLQRLNCKKLEDEALQNPTLSLSTAELGIKAAFELSWQQLDSKTQQVGMFLSLFAQAIIPWQLVESAASKEVSLLGNQTEISTAKNQLFKRHLIKKVEITKPRYKIHPLIREFLQTKLAASPEINELKQAFITTFIEIGETIPETSTLEFRNSVKNAIPHLTEVAENHLDAVSDDNLFSVLVGLGKFYQGQGLYTLAEPWYEKYRNEVESRFGKNHLNYAFSLNWLGSLYDSQGKYEQAEPLYIQALDLRKQLLGENHLQYASSLNLLASLYDSQGKYEQAEPLYIQALELRKQLLGENHPDTAQSLNNLAYLYDSQGKYEQAEPLYIQALELRKQLLGENHPDTAQSLNNLAYLYDSQGKYEQAEPLFIQALELRKQLLGENHPDTATSLNNLAALYYSQERYLEAEPLYKQAIEIAQRVLGTNHPNTVLCRKNLDNLREKQRKVPVEQQPSRNDSWLEKFIRFIFG